MSRASGAQPKGPAAEPPQNRLGPLACETAEGAELFPLPMPEPLKMISGLSRGSGQRLARKVRARFELRETISSLNWMHVGDFDARPSQPCTQQQLQVLRRLHGLVEKAGDLGEPGHMPLREAAYKELLHGLDGYTEPSTPASLAPFNLELISLPSDLTCASSALELLQGDDRRYLEEQERMLLPADSIKPGSMSSPYWDPALKNNPREYRRFIQKLCKIGYLDFTLYPSQHAGVFFVWKSDKKKIRMIIDARPANAVFRDPPGVALSTAETFSKIKFVCGEDDDASPLGQQTFSPPAELFAGLSDVKDCFHRVKQPRWLSKYFCLMPIEARHVGLTGQVVDGLKLRSQDLVYPMPGSLCMGFSWSLFFAQRINEVQMEHVPSLASSKLINDRSGPAVFSHDSSSHLKHFVYVDNLGVMSNDRDAVVKGLEELSEQFTGQSLLLHPGEVQHERIKALGVELDGRDLVTRVSPARFHRVRQGLRFLLQRNRCTGRALEILVGHCTYCGLVNRCSLSIFHSVYKFIKKNYSQTCALWKSVAAELRAFAGIMPALRADWSRPWNGEVVASDASEEGFGVCSRAWPASLAAQVGRTAERDRFKRAGGHNARESALTSAGFVRDDVTGRWLSGDLADEDYLEASGWKLDEKFPEVPATELTDHEWFTVRQGQWRKAEHIVHLEARSLVKAMEVIAQDRNMTDCRQLLLVDSMSSALAFGRCRSRNYKMLRQIRKFCAYSIGCNIGFSVRWIPSELNPADEPSRVFSTKPSLFSANRSSYVAKAVSNLGATGTSDSRFCEAGTHLEPRSSGKSAQWEEPQNTFADQTKNGSAAPSRPFGASEPVGGSAKSQLGSECWLGQRAFSVHVPISYPTGPRQEVGEKEQATAEEVHRRNHVGLLSGVKPSGEKGHRQEDREVLPPRVCRPHEVCEGQGEAFSESFRHRPGDHGLFQPPLCDRPPCPQGRQDFGSFHAPECQLQQAWIPTVAKSLQSHEGVAKIEPRFVKESISFASVVSNRLRDEASRSYPDGFVHHDGCLSLHQAQRTAQVPGVLTHQAFAPSDGALVLAAEPRRAARTLQNRGVRRQHPFGLRLSEALGPAFVQGIDNQRRRRAVVELRLWPLLQSVSGSDRSLGSGRHPVPDETQWTINRSEQGPSALDRGSKARPVEKSQEPGSLREVGPSGCQLPTASAARPTALPARRVTSRGCDVWPGPCSSATFQAKGLKGQYVADLFSGHGGVASQCRLLGYAAKEWELERGAQFDLTQPRVLRRLQRDISTGLVLAAMLSPPSASFSVAKDRTGFSRTVDFPWGLPPEFLSPADFEKVQHGNRIFQAALKIINWLHTRRIPWVLENPATSKCWLLPELKKLEASSRCVAFFTDFCQFGAAWRRSTKFLSGNLDAQDVERVCRLCSGQGCCSRTQRAHFQLTGSNHQGIPWVQLAQQFPRSLCKHLAFALTAPTHYLPTSSL